MAELPFLPLAVESYLADCGHLSDAEHGRYLLLLMELWRSPNCRIRRPPDLSLSVAEMFDARLSDLIPSGRSYRHADWSVHPSRLLGSTWRKIRNAFLRANALVCAYCGSDSAPHWEVDHIQPRARGGTHAWVNLAVSCRLCNRRKGAA